MNISSNKVASRFARGLGANGITQLSQMVMRLSEVPLLLMFWGAIGYGEWLMIMALPTALLLSDGGITKTAQREMVMCMGRGDMDSVKSIFQSTWLALTFVTPIIVCLSFLGFFYLPVHSWLNITSLNEREFGLAVVFLIAQVFIYFHTALLRGILTLRGKYATGEVVQNISSVMSFFSMAITVAMGGGIYYAATAYAFGALAGYILMVIVVYAYEREIKYGWTFFSFAVLRRLFLPSLANMAFPLSEVINMQGLRLLIGISLGPVALATFSSLRTLCRVALQPILAIGRVLEPEIALAYGAGNHNRVKSLFNNGSRLAVWGALILTIAVAVIGPPAFLVWTGGELEFVWSVFILLIVSSIVNS